MHPWIFRTRAQVIASYCNFPLISTACKIPAHVNRFNSEAFSLTCPQFALSMSLHTIRNTISGRIFKVQRPNRSASRQYKMGGQKQIRQPLPSIHLTPLEEIMKRLLLDVKNYIRQEKETQCGTPQEDIVLRFTGGWVRDKLLGATSHDIDVAISTMTGLQFATYLQEYLNDPDNLARYKNYGHSVISEDMLKVHKIEANPEKSKHLETVTTKLFGLDIDLVNLRKETYTENSRNPQMEFGTPEEDALRRDATVNAMFYNLNTSKLEDFTGLGIEDMNKKLIRTPLEPYQTFKDDPLRVLRLIRFASRLGYRIDEMAQTAMGNKDIKETLKLKISKERVGVEVEKMLQGPDPRTALEYIEKLGLYSVIFANQQDDAEVNVASWSRAYNALDRILRSSDRSHEHPSNAECIRRNLIRDESEKGQAWYVAAFAPWALVPIREPRSKNEKPPPMARTAEVARDNLRVDNKTVSYLKDAATHFEELGSLKISVISNSIPGTAGEVRQHVGLKIRSWKKDWRMVAIMALLQEIMAGAEYSEVIQEYAAFLSYLEKENLLEVTELKPIANGNEVSAALGVRSGRWMTTAMEMLIRWQLLHPEISEKDQALEMLKDRRAELGV